MTKLARDARMGGRSDEGWHRSHLGRAIRFVLLSFFIASQALAGGLVISWDANTEPDLAGYRIYYGTAHSTYDQMIDAGNRTSYVIENLQEGVTYFLVVTAYDLNGNESLPCAELSATVTSAQIYVERAPEGIRINWSALEGATSYSIYAGATPDFTPTTPIAQLTTPGYTDGINLATLPLARYYVVQALVGGTVMHTFDRVGAFNIGLRPGRNLVSVPLLPTDARVTTVLGTQLSGATNAMQADKILYWNGRDYDIAWLVEGSSSIMEGKWVTEAGNQISTIDLDPDRSFWLLLSPDARDTLLTVTGKISTDPNRVLTLTQGPNFVGTCYPVSVSLINSELAADNVVVGARSSATADKMMQWLRNRYDVAWLVGNSGTAWDGTWFNESGSSPTSMTLNPGVGYILWIKNDNPSKVWTYPNPLPNL